MSADHRRRAIQKWKINRKIAKSRYNKVFFLPLDLHQAIFRFFFDVGCPRSMPIVRFDQLHPYWNHSIKVSRRYKVCMYISFPEVYDQEHIWSQ